MTMQHTRLCASSRNAIIYGIGQSSEKKESLGSHAIRLNTAKIDSIQQNRLSSAKCEWSIVKIKKAVPTVARLNFKSLRSS